MGLSNILNIHMRKKIIAGNWKMHKTVGDAIALASGIVDSYKPERVEVVIAPPFTALYKVAEVIRGTHVRLAAQNMFHEPEGAYTGEISPIMLKDIGVEYVIIGHSERRKYFGETDTTVNLKVKSALKHNLIPIVCVGETLDEREHGITMDVVRRQILGAFTDITADAFEHIVIAYEPVWAIGTGKVATPEQAVEVHRFIREVLRNELNVKAENVSILYGGSIKPNNIESLIKEPDIDGGLVGGASLRVDQFVEIVKISDRIVGGN